MSVLSVSTMFPSRGLPRFGVFVLQRLQHVASRAPLRVISGVPTFPIVTRTLKRYRDRLDIPRREVHGEGPTAVDARYPHFLSVPAVAKPLDGIFLAMAVLAEWRRLRSEGFAPDVIDAHLAYPDGFASVLVGALTDTPVVITCRGHDINDMSRHRVRWAMTRFALARAERVVGVCRALIDAAVEAGADPTRARTVINGVDSTLFRPLDKARCRARLRLPADRKIVVSVGHMIERKGFHVLIEAISLMPQPRRPLLVLIGGRGEETDYRPRLDSLVEKLGVGGDVLFTGGLLNTDLGPWYSAADISALASSREGWANVLFESLACGRPVVATDVWGTGECLCRPEYGILVGERSGPAFARALDEALWERTWDAEALTAYAHDNTWDRVGERHLTELARAVADYPRGTRGLAGRALSLITAGGRSS